MTVTFVRARPKPIEELPEGALCCDRIREIHRGREGLILEVIPEVVWARDAYPCPYCHKMSDVESKHMRAIRHPDGESVLIRIDCFDFDEGID